MFYIGLISHSFLHRQRGCEICRMVSVKYMKGEWEDGVFSHKPRGQDVLAVKCFTQTHVLQLIDLLLRDLGKVWQLQSPGATAITSVMPFLPWWIKTL